MPVKNPVAPVWYKVARLPWIVRSLFITTILGRNCYGQGIRKLVIFFEEPFWVGFFECIEEGRLSYVKVTFGARSKEYKV